MDTPLEPFPDWAIELGCPEPLHLETVRQYANRLGMNADELFVDLTPVTVPLANQRLRTQLLLHTASKFDSYITRRMREWKR